MPLNSPKVTVWCGVDAFGNVGPYFFENDNEETVTVNSERYVTMLEGFVEPQLRRLGIDPEALLFQQDGATAHTARNSVAVVREMFGTVISRFGDIAWPGRSVARPYCTRFFPVGVPERPCVPEAYRYHSRTQKKHC